MLNTGVGFLSRCLDDDGTTFFFGSSVVKAGLFSTIIIHYHQWKWGWGCVVFVKYILRSSYDSDVW